MDKMRRLSFILTVALMVGACSSQPTGPASYLARARDFSANKDYTQALAAFRHAAELAPDSVEAWSGLAETYLKLGQTQASIDAFQHVLEIDAGNTDALLRLARFDLLGNRFEGAVEKVRKVLASAPANTAALFLLADIYQQSNRLDQAAATYQRIIQTSSDNKEAYLRLADVQSRQGNVSEAEMALLRAIQVSPEAAPPRLMLFNLYYQRKDYQMAEAVLEDAVRVNPDNADLYIALGKFYFARNNTSKAEDAFNRAIEQAPDNVGAYLLAGNFYNVTGDKQKALSMYDSAQHLSPHNPRIMTLLADFHLENSDLKLARTYIDRILSERPGYFPARLLKIRLLIAEQAYDKALALCDRMTMESPLSDEVFQLQGIAYLEKGDLEQAKTAFARAVEISPGNINARIRLANIYIEQGDIEKARQLNREVFSLLHENFNVDVILGSASLQEMRETISLESTQSLFEVASGNPFGAFRLERLEGLKKKYDQMIDNFEKVLAGNPTLIGVFESIVLMHVVKEEYETALAKCDRQAAILKNSKDMPSRQTDSLLAAVYNLKGGIYLALERRDKAKALFQAAIHLAPHILKPYYALARLYLAEKNLDKAIMQYEMLLEKNPEQTGPHIMLGVLYKMKNDYQRAETHYRQALAIDPAFAKAANNLAYLLAEQPDKLDEALRYALKAKSIEGDDPYIRDTLGWVYYKMGLYEDALRELKACVEAIPNNATANYHLGMVYYRMGDTREAARYLEIALDLSNTFYEADHAREILSRIT